MQKASVTHRKKTLFSRFRAHGKDDTLGRIQEAIRLIQRDRPSIVKHTQKPKSFTACMVALTAALVIIRRSDGRQEFLSLAEVFGLPKKTRMKLLPLYANALKARPSLIENAQSLFTLYEKESAKREKVMERFLKIVVTSSSVITDNERFFLETLRKHLRISRHYYDFLCVRYGMLREPNDPYAILGVSRHASRREIKTKYHDLVRTYHPDRISSIARSEYELRAYNQKLAEINSAYSTLCG